MEAIKFNLVCNKCDDSAYGDATSIVDRLNGKLEGYDPHAISRVSVQGHQTGRYIKLDMEGETEEAINAAEQVFLSAGYFTILEKAGEKSTMYVIFDADIAPGTEEDDEDGREMASSTNMESETPEAGEEPTSEQEEDVVEAAKTEPEVPEPRFL